MLDEHDHRSLGQRLDLFHLQEEAPGMVFWHPRGYLLYRLIEARVRRQMQREGYLEVRTPQVLAQPIWERSGHWDNFRENIGSHLGPHFPLVLTSETLPVVLPAPSPGNSTADFSASRAAQARSSASTGISRPRMLPT